MSVLYRLVICLESVGILSRMCLGYVYLASVAWRGRFVNPQGRNFSISTHKNLVETYAILIISLASLIEISHRDSLHESSRDSHHHSTSHILYEHRNLVEIYTFSSRRDLSAYTHILASSRDMCYHMYIHIEITVCARTYVTHARNWLGRRGVPRYIYSF